MVISAGLGWSRLVLAGQVAAYRTYELMSGDNCVLSEASKAACVHAYVCVHACVRVCLFSQ